ncbi:MAG: hypothetical protein CHACPFDD_03475 [Phycisphaerae bacterium]|nr:hypothetical protein [Phycisphaerae bacterium]
MTHMTRVISSAVALAAVLSASALADSRFLAAQQDFQEISTFTLDFGDVGGTSEAQISQTQFVLQFDAAAGTARFVDYDQQIEPLLLFGMFDTGDITVTIVPGSSSGTYNPATGEFTTTEYYEIAFEGDLSMFGLTSPVVLPSTSSGVVTFETPGTGRIRQAWAGEGELGNPNDPENPISFTYTCNVNTVFSRQFGDMNCDGAINGFDIDPFLLAITAPGDFGTTYPGCDITNADFSGDGNVNGLDVEPFVNVLLGL